MGAAPWHLPESPVTQVALLKEAAMPITGSFLRQIFNTDGLDFDLVRRAN
jgi:hypothetical protein